jgi:hypothetical protein
MPSGCARCHCERAVHEHFRRGTDCGRCGRIVCPRYLDTARVERFIQVLDRWLNR